jgi:GNAT superfamily N-acetyltransferase
VEIRRATPGEAALLAEHRAAVWHEVGGWNRADLEPQIPVWSAFFRDRVAVETYVAFIAEDDGEAIGSGGILIHLTIPRPRLTSDRAGRVQSLYIVPVARRRGVARAIMERILDYARASQLVSVSLHPSDDARPLYSSLGFHAANEMLLRIDEPKAP